MKTLLFVDDEPRVLQGLQRQLRTMRHEWQMHFVASGPEALTLLDTTPVDVLVTDMMMPGMDGAALLAAVAERHPHVVRLVLSGHADREALLRLVGPAHQYLSKPCDPDELRNAVARAFALRQLLASEPLKHLAGRVRCLPTLPTLYTQLTQELQRDEPSMEHIGQIISKDPGLTTKILQLVNSAFFGLAQPITSPAEAVAYLGLTTVRALVLALQVFAQFDPKLARGFSMEGLARHGWMTGVFARRIAEAERRDVKVLDQCLVAGLLHDVGRLVLASEMPEPYGKILEAARSGQQPLWRVEQAELGASHAEVGAYLLGLWGLPNPVVEAVGFHHRPLDCPVRAFAPVIAVHVADALAHEQSAPADASSPPSIEPELLETLGLTNRLELWRERCTPEL